MLTSERPSARLPTRYVGFEPVRSDGAGGGQKVARKARAGPARTHFPARITGQRREAELGVAAKVIGEVHTERLGLKTGCIDPSEEAAAASAAGTGKHSQWSSNSDNARVCAQPFWIAEGEPKLGPSHVQLGRIDSAMSDVRRKREARTPRYGSVVDHGLVD